MEKVLIIQTAFLGDAVLTLPMIQKLKEFNPVSSIDVLCIPSTKEIFEASPFINKIYVYDKRREDKSFLRILSLGKKLKKENYTRIYSPHRSFRTALLVMFSGTKETYGFSNSAFPYVYKNIIKYDSAAHEVKRNIDLIGFNSSGDDWRIIPILTKNKPAEKKISEFLFPFAGKKIAAAAPGSVWNTKIYPAEYYNKIIEYLLDKEFAVVLIGGHSDSDYCEEFVRKFKNNIISAAGKFSITESIQLLKKCDLLISNDSAPTHLGMCADIPVITIYCSTIPDFGFYPYNEGSVSVSYNDLECKPCGIHGYKKCPVGTFDCAHKLDINLILRSIDKIISLYANKKC